MMAPTKSKLNPLAAEFVPGGTQAATSPAAASEACQHQEPGAAAAVAVLLDIMELPLEVCAVWHEGCSKDASSIASY
jgi:hypothetical protein